MATDEITEGCLGFLWSLIVDAILCGTGMFLVRLLSSRRGTPSFTELCWAYPLGLLVWSGIGYVAFLLLT